MEKIITNYLIEHLGSVKQKIYWYYFATLNEDFIDDLILIYDITREYIINLLRKIIYEDLTENSVVFIYIHDIYEKTETAEHICRKEVNWLPDLIVLFDKIKREYASNHNYEKASKYRCLEKYLKVNLNEHGRFD